MKKYVLYHAQCPDGFGSAWAFYKKFGNEAEYYPMNYGEPLPKMIAESELYIADFSFPRDVLLELEKKHKKLVLLDHHRTAEADLRGLPFATFDMKKSGAMLSWEYCHPGRQVPKLIHYLQDRDLWNWTLPHSKECHTYVSSLPYEFAAWTELSELVEEHFEEVVRLGTVLLRSDALEVEAICAHASLIEFEGHKIPCVNTPVLNSEVGHHLLEIFPEAPFSLSWFKGKEGNIKASLRSRGTFDVSELAKEFGGGGHKAAAGCQLLAAPEYK